MSTDDTPLPPPREDVPPPEPVLDAILVPPSGFVPERGPAGFTPSFPDEDYPRRPLARPPHPGFWFALLWCFGFLLVTQCFPGLLGGLIIAVIFMVRGGALLGGAGDGKGSVQDSLTKSPVFAVGMAVLFFFTEILVVGVSWLVTRIVVGRDWTRQLALRRPGIAHLVLTLASCLPLVLLSNGFYLFLKNVVHMKGFSDLGFGGMEEMIKTFSTWPVAFGVLVIGLGPGIGEELWCRGFLGRGLVGHYGWLGIVATSFFFGLIHIDPPQATYAMAAGLWLHFVYLTTRSLWMPMLLHALNNSLSVLATHVEVLKTVDENVGDLPLHVFAAAAVLLAAVGYALYQSRARLASVIGDGPPPWRPPYPGVEYPPPGSGTRVVHPLPSAAAVLAVLAALAAFVACCWAGFRPG
jgi:membrane protease YdiL (CAAX protease family)